MQTLRRLCACSTLALSLCLAPGVQAQASIDISQDLLTTYDIPNADGEYGKSFLVDRNAENRRVGGFVQSQNEVSEGSFTITPAGVTRLFRCSGYVTWTQVRAMNAQGAMVGWCRTPVDEQQLTGFFRSEGGVMTRLQYPGMSLTEATALNDKEVVVGWFVGADSLHHGFRWERRTRRYTQFDAPFPNTVATIPHSITNAGVIGVEYYTMDGTWGGAILRQGQWTPLAIPGAVGFSHLTEDGRLLGVRFDPARGYEGFLWQQGVVTPLQWPLLQQNPAFARRITPGGLVVGRVDTHLLPPPNAPEGTEPEIRHHGFVAPLAALLAPDSGPPPPALAARMTQQSLLQADPAPAPVPAMTIERRGCPDDPPVAGTINLARQTMTWAFCDRLR